VRRLAISAVCALAALVLGAIVIGASAAPRGTVTASPIARVRGTPRPGTRVRSADLGTRVFADARHGFALASIDDGQFPAATADGGRTWRVNGPVLHENAAQAPLSVNEVGIANRRTYFAFGGGQVVDVTSDGGRHWFRAILGDVVVAVAAPGDGRLIAFAQVAGSGSRANTVVYVSRDGGRHWRRTTREGAF
jgi:hypothetical protein